MLPPRVGRRIHTSGGEPVPPIRIADCIEGRVAVQSGRADTGVHPGEAVPLLGQEAIDFLVGEDVAALVLGVAGVQLNSLKIVSTVHFWVSTVQIHS